VVKLRYYINEKSDIPIKHTGNGKTVLNFADKQDLY